MRGFLSSDAAFSHMYAAFTMIFIFSWLIAGDADRGFSRDGVAINRCLADWGSWSS
jgi:hypothetical protein